VIAEAARLQVLLEGVALPASKHELLIYAQEQRAGGDELSLLRRLPEREYRSLDDVGETLAPVQPDRSKDRKLPREESGRPPGGDDYLHPHPTPGKVSHSAPAGNPPQKTLEQQAKTQTEQKERQDKLLEG
jgi:hypothetical protein